MDPHSAKDLHSVYTVSRSRMIWRRLVWFFSVELKVRIKAFLGRGLNKIFSGVKIIIIGLSMAVRSLGKCCGDFYHLTKRWLRVLLEVGEALTIEQREFLLGVDFAMSDEDYQFLLHTEKEREMTDKKEKRVTEARNEFMGMLSAFKTEAHGSAMQILKHHNPNLPPDIFEQEVNQLNNYLDELRMRLVVNSQRVLEALANGVQADLEESYTESTPAEPASKSKAKAKTAEDSE